VELIASPTLRKRRNPQVLPNRDQNLPMRKPGKTRNVLPPAVHESRNQPLTGRPVRGTTSSAIHGKRPQGSRPDGTVISAMYQFLNLKYEKENDRMYQFLNLKYEKEKDRNLSATRRLRVPGVPEPGSGHVTRQPP
jgi:hypothetical protein